MTPDAVLASAEYLAAARLGGPATARPSGALDPTSIADGYRVQLALNDLLKARGFGPRSGHKIGCTTKVMQAYLSIDHPCAGEVFESTVFDSGVSLPLSDYHRIGVECEIAARLDRDLPDIGESYRPESIVGAVESVMPAIELVDDRYIDYPSFSAPALIADDFFNAGVVLGDPVSDWRDLDLASLRGEMRVDGQSVGAGHGRDILGHPMAALAWLANHAVAQGAPLKAGAFVMLGSVVKTVYFDRPAQVEIEFEALGAVSVTFT